MDNRLKAILQQEETGTAVVPEVSIETMVEMWTSAGRTECPLDSKHIISTILKTGSPGKQAVALNLWGGFVTREVFELMVKSAEKYKANRYALLSNTRLDWCDMTSFDRKNVVSRLIFTPDTLSQTEQITAEIQTDLDDGILVAARNPYMDRSLIADFIRGSEPFEAIPIETRQIVARHALTVKYERQPAYPGQDMPSHYEMNFSKPTEALFSMIRKGEIKNPRVWFPALIKSPWSFSIDSKEWLSPEVAEELGDFSHSEATGNPAHRNFIDWMLNWASEEPLDCGADDCNRTTFDRGSFAVSAISCALGHHGFNDEFRSKLKESKNNWVGRAAYYSFLIDQFAKGDRAKNAYKLLLRELTEAEKKDATVLVRAMSCSHDLVSFDYVELAGLDENAVENVSASLRKHMDALACGFGDFNSALSDSSSRANDSDNEFHENELLSAIKKNEKWAGLEVAVSVAFCATISWGQGLPDESSTLLLAAGLIAGLLLYSSRRIETLLLKSELRDLRRYGSRMYDRKP
ncbi:MAG: hypothetical protein K8F59_11040 [Rhodobacteraceae bacterium]|nr:hypothetical protein [Paracoccaceae bacterium]